MDRHASIKDVRADTVEKVTGRAEFVTDLNIPGMLRGFVVRSPAVHARVVSIDTSAALAVAGVVDVLIGADVAVWAVGAASQGPTADCG